VIRTVRLVAVCAIPFGKGLVDHRFLELVLELAVAGAAHREGLVHQQPTVIYAAVWVVAGQALTHRRRRVLVWLCVQILLV
jgi:hypothetical protein